MQFGNALNHYLQEILLADPDIEALYLIKVEISNGFYRISLNINDTPKLGVLFPTEKGQQPLVAIPLLLPTGLKIVYQFYPQRSKQLLTWQINSPRPHRIDDEAENVPLPPADTPSNSFPKSAATLVTHPDRDPSPPLYLLQC